MDCDVLAKTLVIGEVGCGKTSLIKRFCHDVFSHHYKATIGVDFALKTLMVSAHEQVRFQLWDIAGQERFNSMTHVYYRDARACLIVFDLQRRATFHAALNWLDDVRAKLPNRDIPVYLVGNKCDLLNGHVTEQEMDEFVQRHNLRACFCVSAKTTDNVSAMFMQLGQDIMATFGQQQQPDDDQVLHLNDHSEEEGEKQTGCCR